MSGYVIRVVEFANGALCPIEGQYLKTFDHEAFDGQGDGVFTDKVERAMCFPDKAAALTFWAKQSTVKPLRPDGKPNKPLTACSVVIEPMES